MQVRRVRLDVVVLQRIDARRDVIVTNIVRLRVTEVTVRRIRQVDDRLIVAIRQALDIRRERLIDRAIRRRLVFRVDDQCCLIDMQVRRVRLDVVVLQRIDARRDVIVTNIVRLRVTEVTVRRIRQVDDRLIVAIRQALDIRRERLIDRAIRRRLVFRIDGKRCFVDFKVTLCLDDFVVDACTILEADIYHIDSIFIRIWASISRRTTILILSIAAAGLDGKNIGAIVERVVIFFDKGFARYAFLLASERCSGCPVVDGCVAVGLAAAAVDIDLASEDLDGAAVFCGCIGVAARCAFSCQSVAVRSGFNVVNSIIIVCSRFIAARTRCGLCPAFARERAAAIVVISYVAFVEGICIFVDVMLFVILSGKGCLSGGRDIGIRQFFAIDFLHVFGGDIDSRLYLEDVLVAVVFTCRIRSTRCAPLRICATIEVLAERIGIWRVGIDLPVAARASRDGRNIFRGQVLERTVLALYVDDNGIVVLRIGVQRTVVMSVVQYDFAALTRRGQVDILMSRDAIDIDVARSLDIDTLGVSRDAVADCDVLARDADAFVRVDNTRVVLTAADCDITSVDLDILQGNRVTDVTSNIDFRIAGIDAQCPANSYSST